CLCFLVFRLTRGPPISSLFPTRRSSDLGGNVAEVERRRAEAANRLAAVKDFDKTRDLNRIAGDIRRKTSGNHGFVHRSATAGARSEEHTSELQSRENLVCRLLLEKKKKN